MKEPRERLQKLLLIPLGSASAEVKLGWRQMKRFSSFMREQGALVWSLSTASLWLQEAVLFVPVNTVKEPVSSYSFIYLDIVWQLSWRKCE